MALLLSLAEGDVREDWGGGPTGDRAFVILDNVSTLPQGPARSDFDGANELERITSAKLDTLKFETYGRNAYAFAEFARAVLQSERARSIFRALKSGLVTIGTTTDLSGLAGSEEERARFELVVSFNEIVEVELEAIRLADIDVHYEYGVEHVHVTPPDPYVQPIVDD